MRFIRACIERLYLKYCMKKAGYLIDILLFDRKVDMEVYFIVLLKRELPLLR